jgi:hypothetical protein
MNTNQGGVDTLFLHTGTNRERDWHRRHTSAQRFSVLVNNEHKQTNKQRKQMAVVRA